MIRRVLTILSSLLLAACSPGVRSGLVLPTPEYECRAVQDWKGIVPGQSSKHDVVSALGKPTRVAGMRFAHDPQPYYYYAYLIEDGNTAGLIEDRIFFSRDGTVSWIEATVTDQYGQPLTIEDIVEEVGATLDQVYVNNNFRSPKQPFVKAGPDQIYVWAECGLAVSAESPFLGDSGMPPKLSLRHPVPSSDSIQPAPAVWATVLFKFLFPPTSYDGFVKFYEKKVPFGEAWW